MSHPKVPLIQTKRLTLTWPTREQIDGYYHAIVDTNIFDTIFWEGPDGVEELYDWWDQTALRDPLDFQLDLNMAVIERSSERYIGGVSLRPVERDPAIIDIGYAFAEDSHGKGYATEAVRALVDEAFLHRKAERIFGNAFVGNQASRRVMEKVGFVCEGTMRRAVLKRGVWLDQWMIAITRPDWESSRA